jgi:hypothetical protein
MATIRLPPDFKEFLKLLNSEKVEGQSWAMLTAEQFLAGYADGDAIYDQLQSG